MFIKYLINNNYSKLEFTKYKIYKKIIINKIYIKLEIIENINDII
jgi:hypothetical protein